jgi:tetratricopeptide (TPR) repeat protein
MASIVLWRSRTMKPLICFLVLAAYGAGSVHAADRVAEARDHYKRGLAAYGLGNYSEAAGEYEAAFKLEPDPALLYNAAQAHRLGGNSERALELYQSYLRLFGGQIGNRAEVERHIAGLKTAIQAQKSASSSPPVTPKPMTPSLGTPAVETSAPPAAATTTTAAGPLAAVATTRADAPAARSWYQRGWVWGVAAGGLAAVGLGVGLGLGLQSHDPRASMGTVSF